MEGLNIGAAGNQQGYGLLLSSVGSVQLALGGR